MNAEILVTVARGGIVESIHRGHLAVVDGDGNLIAGLGNPETVTFLRSAAKPFQAIPFLLSGAAERFGFNEKEIALACASHNSEPVHTETAARMLEKGSFAEKDLRCGAHEPFSIEIARLLLCRDEKPSQLHNNCSGKHAAMLAFARQINARAEDYDSPENPVQQQILEIIERFSGVPRSEIGVGIDGCSAPNFALPLVNLARMLGKLILPPENFSTELREACRRIVTAMMSYPEMIGGENPKRLDTLLMRALRGQIVSKIGAEGVYTAGILPNPRWKRGLGIALKIEDGSDRRARPVAVLEALRQLGILNPQEHDSLKPFALIKLRNHRKTLVGEAAPNFSLKFNQ
ncbi:MAG: asparaginase [Acidobacteriota bacterium]|nr:asparaginase [Acidobacteriota bacterium]